MFAQEEIPERKAAFAAASLRYPLDPHKAATDCEARPAHAAFMAANWPLDPEVQELIRKFREDGGTNATIPTKEEFAAALWKEAGGALPADIKLKYFELFAKVQSYISAPAPAIVNNNNVVDNRRVMLMPAPLPLDEWERQAVSQQAKLINAASQ